jgi:AcrR family transcriptional regulator
MTTRRYSKSRRAELEAETQDRIMRATVALHARHGALGTSYAMIAQEAGVSPQTVYNHFPNIGQLIRGCTSHVLERAPGVDASCFTAGESVEERLRLLARAACRQVAYMSPWLRFGWGDAEVIPELREIFDQGQSGLRQLLAQAVAPEYRATPEFLDAALVLLDYPAWKSFSQDRTPSKAAKLAGDCLIALLPALSRRHAKEAP